VPSFSNWEELKVFNAPKLTKVLPLKVFNAVTELPILPPPIDALNAFIGLEIIH
jgi:hypothetical protein